MANTPKNQPNSGPVHLEVAGLLNDDESDNPVLVLKDKQSERVLLMWIGDTEAQSIDLAIQRYTKKVKIDRPLMQKLLINVVDSLQGKLEYVIVDRLKNGTYFASIVINTPAGVKFIDARPSDAVIIAIEACCPLLADRGLFTKSSSVLHAENIKQKPNVQRKLEINISFLPATPEVQCEDEECQSEELKNTILPPHEHSSLDARQLTKEDLQRIQKQISEAQTREQNTQL